MDIHTAKEVLAALPQGKTAYRYCKDRYAVYLLSEIIGKQCPIAALKRSPYVNLLDKPLIKQVIAQSGGGLLRQEQLALAWSLAVETFLLTLDIWGGLQVSRSGFNLVLQLNFSSKHDVMFKKLADPDDDHYFNCCGHPVMKKGKGSFFRETLAWSRIDFDFNTNEALIEELQTDWVRTAKDLLSEIKSGNKHIYYYGAKAKPERLKIYLENVLQTYGNLWDEALLTATLHFIRQELGIAKIYLHSAESGAKVKRIYGSNPPSSLYSTLPKRFCFRQTYCAPEFLLKDRKFRKVQKRYGKTYWHVINLGETYDDIAKAATEKPGRHVALVA